MTNYNTKSLPVGREENQSWVFLNCQLSKQSLQTNKQKPTHNCVILLHIFNPFSHCHSNTEKVHTFSMPALYMLSPSLVWCANGYLAILISAVSGFNQLQSGTELWTYCTHWCLGKRLLFKFLLASCFWTGILHKYFKIIVLTFSCLLLK